MKRICFIKEFVYWHPEKRYFAKFERMKRYKLPDIYANWFIAESYAFEYGLLSELPTTAYYPKELEAQQ